MNAGTSFGTRLMIGAGLAAAMLAVHAVATEIGSEVDELTDGTIRDYDSNLDRLLSVEYETSRMETWRARGRSGQDRFSLSSVVIGADVNGDGMLDRAELRAAVARYDRDQDGRVSGEELRTFQRDQKQPYWALPTIPVAGPTAVAPGTRASAGAAMLGGAGGQLIPSMAAALVQPAALPVVPSARFIPPMPSPGMYYQPS